MLDRQNIQQNLTTKLRNRERLQENCSPQSQHLEQNKKQEFRYKFQCVISIEMLCIDAK
jgi:hypothetical protein